MPRITRLPSHLGRPKEQRPSEDIGTPELIMKRIHNLTEEAIDLCLQRQIITEKQHWCAIHMRWLYTIRYGAPCITALDLTRENGLALYEDDDPSWAQARNDEYEEAADLLKSKRRYQPVMAISVYNEHPRFLNQQTLRAAFDRPALRERINRDIYELKDGLDMLVQHWRR